MSSENGKKKNSIFLILAIICSIIFLCCVVWLIKYAIGLKTAQSELNKAYTYISEGTDSDEASTEVASEVPGQTSEEKASEAQSSDVEEVVSSESEIEETEPAPEPVDLSQYGVTDRVIDFDSLKAEVNKDIYSWIVVPGTVIDYPVLQHPTESDYYLSYNLDGSKGYPGCIYTQNINNKDWTNCNTVLYGHNMKNGTMFAALHKYKSQEFFEENPYIYIYRDNGEILVYKIFAAYEFSDAHLLMSFPLYTDADVQNYFDSIWDNEGINSNFDTSVELTAESRIITLSTCISNKPNNRYLVQGVLIAEGEQ